MISWSSMNMSQMSWVNSSWKSKNQIDDHIAEFEKGHVDSQTSLLCQTLIKLNQVFQLNYLKTKVSSSAHDGVGVE